MFSIKEQSIGSFLDGLEGSVLHNEPMGNHSRWNVGGNAQCYYPAVGKAGVVQLMCQLPGNIPVHWLGSGNNTLVRDGGIKGVTLSAREGLSSIRPLGDKRVYVESGVNNVTLVNYLTDKGFEGVDFLNLSRGTLGGSLAMGVTELEKWAAVKRLECVNRDGDLVWCEMAQLSTLLRDSNPKKQAWIVGAEFEFQEQQTKRNSKLTLLKNMAGQMSVFMSGRAIANDMPTGIYESFSEISPAALLKDSGLAGYAIGGAAFDEQAPNELTLVKNTRVDDVENLVDYGRRVVKHKFNVQLNPLITFVGERA